MDEKQQAARDALMQKIEQLAKSSTSPSNVEHLARAYVYASSGDPEAGGGFVFGV